MTDKNSKTLLRYDIRSYQIPGKIERMFFVGPTYLKDRLVGKLVEGSNYYTSLTLESKTLKDAEQELFSLILAGEVSIEEWSSEIELPRC